VLPRLRRGVADDKPETTLLFLQRRARPLPCDIVNLMSARAKGLAFGSKRSVCVDIPAARSAPGDPLARRIAPIRGARR